MMEQNIFDVSDDISFPWLPAYGEATEANPLNATSSRMLETIVEETSDDDDGRGDKDQGGSQQPLSWSQYDQVWSSGGSDAESVIRVETPSDQDTMSERDFICPPKRRKQETASFGDEFLASDLSAMYGRRPRICEPDGLEPNEYFMKRHNEQRLRFDEIGHDLFTDSDSLSYASLSRSSSLIQFESLERQLQSETSANQHHPLSGSSPSLYTSESSGPASHAGGGVDPTGRGKSLPPAIGAGVPVLSAAVGSNLLTTSNLMQKSIGQTALNISDSELYSTSSSVSSSCGSGPDSSSNASTSTGSSSSSSSGFRYTDTNRAGVVKQEQTGRGAGGGATTPEDAGDTEEELLSATVRCHSGRCSAERQRLQHGSRGIAARNKNSIESLSEDSGYCDHLQHGGGSMNSGLRARSKSLTNFGSAENITFVCGTAGGGALFPSTLLPAGALSMTQQQHEQQQPLSLDCIAMEVRGQAGTSLYHENRLSTVCDVDEEEEEDEEYESKCDDGCSADANCIIGPSRTPATIERQQQHQLWTNINNGTKIERGSVSCKQRTGESRQQQGGVESATRTVTSMASSSRSECKNSTRWRPALSLSAPDLLVGAAERHRRRPGRSGSERTGTSAASGTVGGLYDPISFTVSSVPECLHLYGGAAAANRSHHGSYSDGDSASGEFGRRHAPSSYGYVDSVASQNVNLYDLQPRPAKGGKTVTFQTGAGSSPARPRQNIRASYANLTALNYSDEDEEDGPVYGGRRGHEYYLSRNTFRTSSGTRLGGASRTTTAYQPIVPQRTTTLLTVPDMEHRQPVEKMDAAVLQEDEEEEEQDLADDEESAIFPVDRDERSVFHSLLEEMSAHFDRNLSIINDQAEAYEPIAAFLHEQRTAGSCGGSRPPPVVASPSVTKTPPQAPPRRTQIKTNPHHAPQQAGSSSSPAVVPAARPVATNPGVTARRRTFDQDPTNLVTCYAASLERCTFDPTESSTTSLGPSAADLHTNDGVGVALPARYVPVPVKREFVASTPNLHYYHGAVNGAEAGEETRHPDHHNSLRNVSTCRSTGSILATASSSRCGLSKGVSFCPIVSEIIWKSTGSSDLEPDDNGSVISNQDFEIDIDEDDFEADDMDHVNYQLETGAGLQRNGVPEREHTKSDGQLYPSTPLQSRNKSEGELYAMIREEEVSGVQHPTTTLIVNDRPEPTVRLNGGSVGGAGVVPMTPSDISSAGQPARFSAMSGGAGGGVVAAEEERRNGAGPQPNSANGNGAMASRSLIASEMRLVNSVGDGVGVKGGSAATMPNQYSVNMTNNNNNNNSSLIKNFKNGKAEKKGKTFLSRISSGFRFSFRNKSKKAMAVGGAGAGAGGGMLKQSSSFTAPSNNNNNNNNHISAKNGRGGGSASNSGKENVSADFIFIPLKDRRPNGQPRADEPPTYLQRQLGAAGVTVDDSFTGAEDEPDDCEIAVTRPGGSSYYRSGSSTALHGEGSGPEQHRGGNHVLSSKPPLPKQPPRVVGVCAKRSSASPAKHAHAPRGSPTPPPREAEQDELDSSGVPYGAQRRSPSQPHQYATANGSYGCASSASYYRDGPDTVSIDGGYEDEYYYGAGGGAGLVHQRGSTMGSEQKIGLIETNLDTHETIISGKTRSLMELGGGQHYRGVYHHLQQHQHQQPHHHHHQNQSAVHGHQLQVHNDPAQPNGAPEHHSHHHRQPGGGDGPGRPHKSMEFLLDKENQRNVLPPENELQKSHETGTNLSEHQLRVQASLQRLNIPDWYKQYSGKDGPGNATPAGPTTAAGTTGASTGTGGGILRKRNSDVGRWTGLSSKTTSLSSLGSHRSDRSPVMLSPSAHSHHGQTGFSRWSTSHLNSNQTSPSVSTRGSFTRGGLNASVISGYSTASAATGANHGNGSSTIRNSFRQPYLGWRSQEKLSQPRTPAERLASSLLQQQQGSSKQKDHQQQQQQSNEPKGKQQQQQQKDESVVTPEIQSSIIEVTSAIVHYVNDQTNRHSRSRSTSPSQRCWLESSFVGTRPLDSPQTPLIENSSVLGSGHQQQQQQQHQHQQQQPHTAGDHYRFNAGRMNGVGESTLI